MDASVNYSAQSSLYRPGPLSFAFLKTRCFFLCLLCAGCLYSQSATAQGVQTEDQPAGSVAGTVLNSVTHGPISRALVYSPDNRFATMTDDEGHFEFTLSKGESIRGVQLLARKPGFLPDGWRTQINTAVGTSLSLVPEGLIVGRVVLSASEPAVGINVLLLSRQVQEGRARWLTTTSVMANSNGEFRFADLPPGTYKLLTNELLDYDPVTSVRDAQLFGFPPVYYPGATDFAGAGEIQLAAGQAFQAEISLARQAYYAVRIPLANVDANQPMSISVSPHGNHGPGYSLGYDDAKKSITGMLPNGSYLLDVAGYGPNAGSGTVHFTVAGGPVVGPTLTLVRNASISVNVREEFTPSDQNVPASTIGGTLGSVYSAQGPRFYLNVVLEPLDDFSPHGGGSLRPPTRPDDDSLVIENVQPGRYRVRVYSSRGYAASVSSGGSDLLHQALVVGAGASSAIEITMRDDIAMIDGIVEGANASLAESDGATTPRAGPYSPSAYVYCVPLSDGPGQFTEVPVSEDGTLSARQVPPGSYRLLAFKRPQPQLEYGNADAMKAYDARGPVVRLVAGAKEHVRLQLISISE